MKPSQLTLCYSTGEAVQCNGADPSSWKQLKFSDSPLPPKSVLGCGWVREEQGDNHIVYFTLDGKKTVEFTHTSVGMVPFLQFFNRVSYFISVYCVWCVLHLVCTAPGVYCAWCVLHLVCTAPGVYCAWCVLRLVCTAPGVYCVWCVLRLVCTASGVYCVWCVLHLVCTVSGVYCVWPLLCLLCTASGVFIGSKGSRKFWRLSFCVPQGA